MSMASQRFWPRALCQFWRKEASHRSGRCRIVDRTVDSIIFDGDGASSGLGRIIRQGAIHFARLDRDKTRVDFALDVPRGKELLLGGAIFQMLGLAAIAAGFWLLRTYVADAPNPGVRARRCR